MEAAAASFSCQKGSPFASCLPFNSYSVSFRLWQHKKALYLSKPAARYINARISSTYKGLHPVFGSGNISFVPALKFRTLSPVGSVKCFYSSSASAGGLDDGNIVVKAVRNLSLESMKSALVNLTPFEICKWCFFLCVAIAISKRTVGVAFNPFFWMYFSWTWLFWPWIVAIILGVYGVYGLRKHLKGEASLIEQLGIVSSTITWLTLVPPATFNGFLEGWPFVFFFVYHYFFFLNVSVRKRLYGDYNPREHDPKWDISLPNWQKLLFCIGVMAGHWLAGFEGTELHLVPGGWHNVPIWILIMCTIFMQYHSTLFLAKYSEKIVVPTSVVQFGPYRFVRHPIYASTILLFTTYFYALRAPLSSVFIIGVCLLYYAQKAKLEEALMLETFGDRYKEYMNKVRYKLIPMVY